MDWATQKRLKYFIALIFLALLIVAFFAFSIFHKPATCSDGKQNGNEHGIDCGGSCKYLCASEVVPIEIVWSRAVESSEKKVNLIAYIRNENKSAVVTSAPYVFVIYDNQGNVIKKIEGDTKIPANGSVAVFAGPVDIGERKVGQTTFEWTSPFYFSSIDTNYAQSAFETINTNLEHATTTTNLSGTLRNTKRVEYKNIPVVAIIYDKNDNAVLASRTIIDEIAPEGNARVTYYWNLPLEDEVSKIELIPYFENF